MELHLLLAHLRAAADAPGLAQKGLPAITRPYVVEKTPLTPSFSCGYATFPEAGRDADTLMQNVHATLFHVRGGGKGGIAGSGAIEREDLTKAAGLERTLAAGAGGASAPAAAPS